MYTCRMEKRTAVVRVEGGVVSVDVDISPGPDPEALVPLVPSDEARDEDEVRQTTSHRLPRWIEIAGGV